MQAQTNIMQVTKFIRTAKIGGSYVIQVNTNGINNWVTVGGGIDDVLAMNQPLSAHRTISGGAAYRNLWIDSVTNFVVRSVSSISLEERYTFAGHTLFSRISTSAGASSIGSSNIPNDTLSSISTEYINGVTLYSSLRNFKVNKLRTVSNMSNKVIMTWDSTTNDWEAALLDSIIVLGAGSGIASLGNSPYGLTKPNDSTYTADSSLLATRLRLKHVNDSTAAALTAEIGTRLEIADTTDMLTPYLRKIDTTGKWIGSGWLSLFVKYGDTASTIATRTWVGSQGYVTTRDRFGFTTEDVSASADRTFNLNNNKLDLDSGSLHIKRKVTGQRTDDIFSVGNGSNKSFYVAENGQVYATEFFSGSGSFYSIGGALGINGLQVNLSGNTIFQAFQKKFEINKSWPALLDSIGFQVSNDTFGISTLPATWANTYKIVSLKFRDGVDNSETERFDFRGNGDFNITGTGATKFQSGNTSQRPSSPTTGMFRYNTDSTSFEYYNGSAWLKFGTASGGSSDGYVDNATFNTTTNYLTIEQTGAADVSVRIPPSYIRNSLNSDSIGFALNDSTFRLKSVSVTSANSKITVNTTRNDSALIHQLTVNEANFSGIPQSAVTNLTTDLGNKLNISDTANKWVTHLYRKPGTDSVFYVKGGTHTFTFKDSISTSGGGGNGISILGNTGNLWLTRVNDSTYAVDSATLFDYGLRRNDSASAANLTGFTTDTYLRNFVKIDTTTLASFGAGGGQAGDTTAFSTSTIYGSFYNDGIDTLVITSMRGILQGTSPSVTYDVYYNDSLNVTAGASKLVTAGTALTNTATGAAVTSFNNTKIPPGVWVWVKTTTVTTKPTYFSLSLIGYKSRKV